MTILLNKIFDVEPDSNTYYQLIELFPNIQYLYIKLYAKYTTVQDNAHYNIRNGITYNGLFYSFTNLLRVNIIDTECGAIYDNEQYYWIGNLLFHLLLSNNTTNNTDNKI